MFSIFLNEIFISSTILFINSQILTTITTKGNQPPRTSNVTNKSNKLNTLIQYYKDTFFLHLIKTKRPFFTRKIAKSSSVTLYRLSHPFISGMSVPSPPPARHGMGGTHRTGFAGSVLPALSPYCFFTGRFGKDKRNTSTFVPGSRSGSRTTLVIRAEESLSVCPGRLFQTRPNRHISIYTAKHSPFIKPYNRLADLTGLFCCEVKADVYPSNPSLSVDTIKSSSCRAYFRVSLVLISTCYFLLQ